MKKTTFLVLTLILLISCKSKILILGEKISQKDICLDLGYGNRCNPFPYGESFFMNLQRASIPIEETDLTENKIKNLLYKFIGGQLINGKLITPNQIDLKDEWYYSHSPIKLDQSFVKKKDFQVEIPLDEIIESIIATENLTASEEKQVKDKIENSYKNYSESKGTIELLYHSINLSGDWYNSVLSDDSDAKSLLTSNRKCLKKSTDGKCKEFSYNNKLNDNNKFIGGIGAIEYKIRRLDSLQSILKAELKSNLGIPIAEKLSAKFTNEVIRNTTISAPKRLDVVFVSTLNPKFFNDVK